MDLFLYDRDLRHERVKSDPTNKMYEMFHNVYCKSKLLINPLISVHCFISYRNQSFDLQTKSND